MDDYFLSTDNPVANVDQHELESVALRLLDRPEMQRARAMVSSLWRNVTAYPAAEQMSRFDGMIDEYVFQFALRGANSDACFPKVLRSVSPPGRWFGRDVPGSRWGGDSPDFIYRNIPIEHGGRYEVSCTPRCDLPPSATYSLMGRGSATPPTLAFIDSADMARDEKGNFLISIDSTPAEGRPNHLQTQPTADHLLIRDALGDWLAETPYALRVRRLDKPDRMPMAEEAMARLAVQGMIDCLYYAYYISQSGNGQPPNTMRAPVSSGSLGGMASQWGTKINLSLAEDEALIVTANSAGAHFRSAVLCDLFFMSTDYWARTSSLNHVQMAADDDDRFTYVVSHQDPGIHNWLDTGGLRRTIFGHRWQAIPQQYSGETPSISARLVKFADLDARLASGVRRIDAAGRREQIARREAGFKRRFIDC